MSVIEAFLDELETEIPAPLGWSYIHNCNCVLVARSWSQLYPSVLIEVDGDVVSATTFINATMTTRYSPRIPLSDPGLFRELSTVISQLGEHSSTYCILECEHI